mgnify:CR=1 FL=1
MALLLSPTAARLGELYMQYKQGTITDEQRLAAKLILFGGMTARATPASPATVTKALQFATPGQPLLSSPGATIIGGATIVPGSPSGAETFRTAVDPGMALTVRKSSQTLAASPWTPANKQMRTPAAAAAVGFSTLAHLGFSPEIGSGRRARASGTVQWRAALAMTPRTAEKTRASHYQQHTVTPCASRWNASPEAGDERSYASDDSPFSCVNTSSASDVGDSPFACTARAARGSAARTRLLSSSPLRTTASSPCPPPPSPQQIAEVAAVNSRSLSMTLKQRIALARQNIASVEESEAPRAAARPVNRRGARPVAPSRAARKTFRNRGRTYVESKRVEDEAEEEEREEEEEEEAAEQYHDEWGGGSDVLAASLHRSPPPMPFDEGGGAALHHLHARTAPLPLVAPARTSLSLPALRRPTTAPASMWPAQGTVPFDVSVMRSCTELFALARAGDAEMLLQLLEEGSMPLDIVNSDGCTMLIVAAKAGQIETAVACVRLGVDVDAVDHRGNTAMHYGCAFGHTAIVDALRERGARTDILNEDGWNAYEGI